MRADGRLRQVELMRGLGKAAQFANGHEGAQEIGRDVDLVDQARKTFAVLIGIQGSGATGAGAVARTTFAHGIALASSPALRRSIERPIISARSRVRIEKT